MQIPVLGRALRTVYANMDKYGQIFSHFRPKQGGEGGGGEGATNSYALIFEDFRLPPFYPIAFTYARYCMMWIHCDFMDRSL